MAIKETVNESSFIGGFSGSYADNFSYKGRKALYEYLWDLSEDIGEDIEYDPVAICCDYSEYESIDEFNSEYGEECESLDDIRDLTTVIEIENSGRFIIQCY